MPLFLDLDIVPMPPDSTGSPSALSFAPMRCPLAEKNLVQHHPLREQIDERLIQFNETQVAHRLGPKARIQQVQDCVLDAPDVLIHRHPVGNTLVHHGAPIIRTGVAQVVPGRIHERVHGVGFAPRRAAARWAADLHERRGPGKWVAAAIGHQVFGQKDRQVLVRHWDIAALATVDERDRSPPVALARDTPVAQAILHAFSP
jgi:hypothetical protein